jgi:histidinol-phosphate aminotransferase
MSEIAGLAETNVDIEMQRERLVPANLPGGNGPRPRSRVLAMPEYHPPLASRTMLRLDFNENTFAPSPKVIERIRELTAEGLTVYPEREHAERSVAEHFGLKPGQVLLTNGVDEGIHLLCLAFLEEGDEALIATPTFFMYDVSVGMMTAGLKRVQSDASLKFPVERFLEAITPRTKLIMVSSPNNPTGATVSCEDLLQVCAAAPQAVVLVDEAYFHFHGETVLGDVGLVKNLVVGRTFSKAYGLANLRLGILAGSAELMGYVRKVASPYNVNGIALECLPVALGDQEYLDWYVGQVQAGRERVMRALEEMGVRYWKSEANFVLFEVGPRHKEMVERMREKGVLLRDRSSDPGCDGLVRITVGIEEHVTRGIEALEETMREMGLVR